MGYRSRRATQKLKNAVTLLLIGVVGFWGFQEYQKGTFRGGFEPALKRVVRKIPMITKIPIIGPKIKKYTRIRYRKPYRGKRRRKGVARRKGKRKRYRPRKKRRSRRRRRR